MDPNACLTRYLTAIDDCDHCEVQDAWDDLAGWIRRGGFEPDWEAAGITRAVFLASRPHDPSDEPEGPSWDLQRESDDRDAFNERLDNIRNEQ